MWVTTSETIATPPTHTHARTHPPSLVLEFSVCGPESKTTNPMQRKANRCKKWAATRICSTLIGCSAAFPFPPGAVAAERLRQWQLVYFDQGFTPRLGYSSSSVVHLTECDVWTLKKVLPQVFTLSLSVLGLVGQKASSLNSLSILTRCYRSGFASICRDRISAKEEIKPGRHPVDFRDPAQRK